MTATDPMDSWQSPPPVGGWSSVWRRQFTKSAGRPFELPKRLDLRRGSGREFPELRSLFGLQPLQLLQGCLLFRLGLRILHPRDALSGFLELAVHLTQCRLEILQRRLAKNLRSLFQRHGNEVWNQALHFRNDGRIELAL